MQALAWQSIMEIIRQHHWKPVRPWATPSNGDHKWQRTSIFSFPESWAHRVCPTSACDNLFFWPVSHRSEKEIVQLLGQGGRSGQALRCLKLFNCCSFLPEQSDSHRGYGWKTWEMEKPGDQQSSSLPLPLLLCLLLLRGLPRLRHSSLTC